MNIWDKSKNVSDDDKKEATKAEPRAAVPKPARPLRRKVTHKKCQTVSTLGIERASAFAKDPNFDSELYCAHCQRRFLVSEFTWQS